jgi:hypothetical protein
VESLTFPDPPTTQKPAPSPPTLPPDLSSVGEAVVPGATTTTLPAIGPGHATLNGSVFGPNGPVGGATVEADRFVGDLVTSARATTAADGSWSIKNILGGRFRVRAWQPPTMDLTTPQIVFLGSTQTLTMSLQLASFKGPNLASSISPPAPTAGQPTNLLVQVSNPTVDTDGVVRYPPAANTQVTLVDGPNWVVDGGNPQTTNGDGEVLFQITCQQGGAAPISAAVGSQPAVPLQMPSCSEPIAPPPVTNPGSNLCEATTVPADTVPGEGPTSSTTLTFGACG